MAICNINTATASKSADTRAQARVGPGLVTLLLVAQSCLLYICLEHLSQNGEECMVPYYISDEDAAKIFPQHVVKEVPSGEKYMRITPQPTGKN